MASQLHAEKSESRLHRRSTTQTATRRAVVQTSARAHSLPSLNGPRKPRCKGTSGQGRATSKAPEFCAVERKGQLRRRVVADVTAAILRDAICEEVDSRARLM